MLTWDIFTVLVLQHFLTSSQENLVGKFDKLMQTSSVEVYIREFEQLWSHLLTANKLLTEDFYVASFLSGLRQDIQQALYVYKPATLQEAMIEEKEQDVLVSLLEKRAVTVFKGQIKSFLSFMWGDKREGGSTNKSLARSELLKSKEGINKLEFVGLSNKLVKFRRITPAEMAKRREQGLCYNCDEKFTQGHRCSRPQLFMVIAEDDTDCDESPPTNDNLESMEEKWGEDAGLSIHALSGTNGLCILNLSGYIKNKTITILLDTRSTHNFVSTSLVKTQKTRHSILQSIDGGYG